MRCAGAMASLAVVLAACSSLGGTDDPGAGASAFPTTSEGFLLPPSRDDPANSPGPTIVTEFESRASCSLESGDVEVAAMESLVSAYNDRDTDALPAVLNADHIWDPSALPLTGLTKFEDPESWTRLTWEAGDELRLVSVRPLDGGSDGILERRNDRFEEAGLGWVEMAYKVQQTDCTITTLVIYQTHECSFYDVFGDVMRDHDVEPPPDC